MIPAVGEDPRGVGLPRRGTPLGGLPRPDLPRHRPPSMHTVLQNTVCPWARAGEFLLGADEFLGATDWHARTAKRRLQGAVSCPTFANRRNHTAAGRNHCRMERLCMAPPLKIPTDGEDLGGTRLLRRGRSLGGLPRPDLPGTGPNFAYCITNTVRLGACAGKVFCYRIKF